MKAPTDVLWNRHKSGQSNSSEKSPQSSCLSHLNAALRHFPFEQRKVPCGQAGARQTKGMRVSHVVSSHDCSRASPVDAWTQRPNFVFGWCSAQNPGMTRRKIWVNMRTREHLCHHPSPHFPSCFTNLLFGNTEISTFYLRFFFSFSTH